MESEHQVSDEMILEGKKLLQPVMPREDGMFQCPLCKRRYEIDGNCEDDGTPLRRLPPSEI